MELQIVGCCHYVKNTLCQEWNMIIVRIVCPQQMKSRQYRVRQYEKQKQFKTFLWLFLLLLKTKQSARLHVNIVWRHVVNTLLVPWKLTPIASIDHSLFVICVQVQEYSPWNEIKPSIFSLGVRAAGAPYCRLDHHPRSFPLFLSQKRERTAISAWYCRCYIYAVNGEIKGCSVTCGSQVIIIQL